MVHNKLPAQIHASERNLVFDLKEIIQFNDPQSLILETRELRARETNDLPEVA